MSASAASLLRGEASLFDRRFMANLVALDGDESATVNSAKLGVCPVSDSHVNLLNALGRRTAHQEAINLSLSLFDCHRAAYRCYAGFCFAIADSDFPSPTIAFGQLNDGVFHSSVFHRISSA